MISIQEAIEKSKGSKKLFVGHFDSPEGSFVASVHKERIEIFQWGEPPKYLFAIPVNEEFFSEDDELEKPEYSLD